MKEGHLSNEGENSISSPANVPRTSPCDNSNSNQDFKFQCTNSNNSDGKYKLETSNDYVLKVEETNSENRLLIDDQFRDAKQVYILQQSNNTDKYFYCNLCGKSYDNKIEFDDHYEQHFNKCSLCLAIFTNSDSLNAHRKEVHGSSADIKVSG